MAWGHSKGMALVNKWAKFSMPVYLIASAYTSALVSSCSLVSSPLDANSTASLKVYGYKSGSYVRIRITGVSQHNILSIYRVKETRYGRVVNVTAFVRFTFGAVKRDLDYTIASVPASVDEITYGPSKVLIWQRSISTRMSST